MAQTLAIDASALDGSGFSSRTYFEDFFDGLATDGGLFFGGDPDSAFGETHYMNGSQHLRTYTDGTDPVAQAVLLDGSDLAYDFIHFGPHMGHGISGHVSSMTFGNWIDGVTTGTQGNGIAGRIAGFGAEVVIDGLDLSAAPGQGNDGVANPVYAIYKHVQNMDAAALQGVFSDYGVEMTGTTGKDRLVGFDHDDLLIGRAGKDVLRGEAGADVLIGGRGSDKLIGQKGADCALGGLGNDVLKGGRGADVLKGGSGNDTLKGGRGADILTGGSGADTFVIIKRTSSDTITDFDGAEDLIDVSELGLATLSDFRISGQGQSTVLTAGQVEIVLDGIDPTDLSDIWFQF